ncbi:MAG: N-6 DNA methylase [Rikenellaceae bacterium]
MAFNRRQAMADNLTAIRLLFELDKAKREATADERAVLQKYCGFGALKCILNPANSLADVTKWTKSDLDLFPLTVQLHSVIRANTSPEEYKQYMGSLKNSILTAFYTPGNVIDSVAKALHESGVRTEKFLDPSAGQGAFMRSFAKVAPMMESTNFEKDLITGKLLKALYPKTDVNIAGFETISSDYKGHFDVVASNIPFGDMSVFDPDYTKSKNPTEVQASKAIHNYFFAKGLDTLRDGGVMAFITSQGVMNSPQNTPIRQLLMERANLVSAIRLPNNLFSDHAGTDVGSDLIILQKNSAKQSLSADEQLFTVSNLRPSGTYLNGYFRNLDRIVHTDWKQDTDPYGKPAIIFKHSGGTDGIAKDLDYMLHSDLKANFDLSLYNSNKEQIVEKPIEVEQKPLNNLYDLFGMSVEQRERKPRQRRQQVAQPQPKADKEVVVANVVEAPTIDLTPRKWEGEILSHHKDGSLVIEAETSQVGYLREFKFGAAQFHPLTFKNDVERERAEAYIPMRDSYYELFNAEQRTQMEHPELRQRLNELYDTYRDDFGVLGSRNNNKFILMDASGRDILSLERAVDGEFIKADIFDHPVAFSLNEVTAVDDVQEALSASLNKFGTVDLAYMEDISGLNGDTLLERLDGQIYYNPMVDGYEIADRFIAGNVVEKAEQIDSYLLDHPNDEAAQQSLKALNEARPRPISFEELDFNFGERWIPTGIYSKYASYLYDTEIKIAYSDTLDDYSVKLAGVYNANIWDKYNVKGSVRSYDGIALMNYALLNTVPDITKTILVDGEERKVRDSEAIQTANTKIDDIRNGFTEWLSEQSPEFKDRLTKMYNDKFNCFVRPSYNGECQSFPNLDRKALGIDDLYKSQKDAVWMIKQRSFSKVEQNGVTYCKCG